MMRYPYDRIRVRDEKERRKRKADPERCPTCESTDRAICRLGGAKVGHPIASASCCPDAWHGGETPS